MCFYFRLPPFGPSNRFGEECLKIQKRQLTRNDLVALNLPILGISLFYVLIASRDSFIKKGEGGAQPNISRVKLIEHLIPLPPI